MKQGKQVGFKIVLIGDKCRWEALMAAVGKTSILQKAIHGVFFTKESKLGVDLELESLTVDADNGPVALSIWDIVRRYPSLRLVYTPPNPSLAATSAEPPWLSSCSM